MSVIFLEGDPLHEKDLARAVAHDAKVVCLNMYMISEYDFHSRLPLTYIHCTYSTYIVHQYDLTVTLRNENFQAIFIMTNKFSWNPDEEVP